MARAYLLYMKRPTREFLPLVGVLGFTLLVGAGLFSSLYRPQPLSFAEGLYVTYGLIFGEYVYPFPRHLALRALYLLLPVMGLVVLLDGIVRYSVSLLRWDPTRREWVDAVTATMSDHVILCGLGNGGHRVLLELVKLGEQVVVVEGNADCRHIRFAREREIPVFVNRLPDEHLMRDLGVERAKSIIICTNDDLANLETALDARRAAPGIRVVLRLYDQDLADKVRESFGVAVVFSRSKLAAPVFASASADRNVSNAFYVGNRLLLVADVEVATGSQLVGVKLGDLRQEYRVHVLSHGRGQHLGFWPDDAVTLAEGDVVSLQTEPQTLRRIQKRNHA